MRAPRTPLLLRLVDGKGFVFLAVLALAAVAARRGQWHPPACIRRWA